MHVTIFKPQLVEMSRKAAKRIKKATEEGVCLADDCDKPAKTRGLCGNCYQAARRLIRDGKITDDELVRAGRMTHKDDSRLGRPIDNKLTLSVMENDE